MTKQFTRGDIDALAQRYRANLIVCLVLNRRLWWAQQALQAI